MVTQECLSQELSESSQIPSVPVTLDTRRATKGCILNQRILNKRSCLQSRKTAGGLSSWQNILYTDEGGEQVYGSADLVNILARILDSERNFNGSADPMITADRGFIQFLGPDFGFWLLGSSDRGSPRCPENLTFSILLSIYYLSALPFL